jgi:hypothetical protein
MGRGKAKKISPFDTFLDDEYQQLRRKLLESNFVLISLLRKIRKDFNIPPNGFASRLDYDRWIAKTYVSNKKTLRQLNGKMIILAEYLFIDSSYLFSLACFNNDKIFFGDCYIYTVGMHTHNNRVISESIKEKGVYIKVHPMMGKNDYLKAFKQTKSVLSHFYRDRAIPPYMKRKHTGHFTKSDVRTYQEVESAIRKAANDEVFDKPTLKSDKRSTVVDRALEAIVANHDLDDNEEENRLKNHIKDVYYRTANRFNLPTYRELHNLELSLQ